jgi:hypothetical protein
MHPMYAADRGCVTTLKEMLDIADALGNDGLGIAVDTYHVWWDPELAPQLARAGKRIIGHHIATGWCRRSISSMTRHDGDGVIDFPPFAAWWRPPAIAASRRSRSFRDWWSRPGDEVLATAVERFRTVCRG